TPHSRRRSRMWSETVALLIPGRSFPVAGALVRLVQHLLVLPVEQRVLVVLRTALDALSGQRGVGGALGPVDAIGPAGRAQHLARALPPVALIVPHVTTCPRLSV